MIGIHHISIVVPDIEEAKRRFSDVLGLKWTTNRIGSKEVWEPAEGTFVVERATCMSKDGPPFIELQQAQTRGSVSGSAGIHHIAVFDPNLDERLEDLRQLGLAVERGPADPSLGTPPTWAYLAPGSFYNVRVEVLSESLRESVTQWIETGR